MVHLPIHWSLFLGHLDSSMPDSPIDLTSLSATCPTTTNDTPEEAVSDGNHDITNSSVNFSDVQVRPASKHLTPKSREAAVRAAKKEIAEKVREDWTWPSTSSHMKPELDETVDTIGWRERDSDSEYSLPSPVLNADPYRFDNPDSIAQPVVSKKSKRQQRLEEEMHWNEGLRTFVERRDVWAGAKIQSSIQHHNPSMFESPYSTFQRPTNGTSFLPTQLSQKGVLSASPNLLSPPLSPSPTILLPLVPPILPPSNPIRASITPDTYPSIYDRIIIRGQSSSIPVNLKDIVHALVAGWKKDGEWPPKSESEKSGARGENLGLVGGDASTRREAQRLAKRSVGRVKRVLGMGRGIDGPGRGEGRREEG